MNVECYACAVDQEWVLLVGLKPRKCRYGQQASLGAGISRDSVRGATSVDNRIDENEVPEMQ